MKIYRLTCLNSDGDIEENGFFKKKECAEKEKLELDNQPYYKRYRIEQCIGEIEVVE
jgi:hypothetical protein